MKSSIALYPTPEQIQTLLTGPADQPVVMVNLLRFKRTADAPDGRSPRSSRRTASRPRWFWTKRPGVRRQGLFQALDNRNKRGQLLPEESYTNSRPCPLRELRHAVDPRCSETDSVVSHRGVLCGRCGHERQEGR